MHRRQFVAGAGMTLASPVLAGCTSRVVDLAEDSAGAGSTPTTVIDGFRGRLISADDADYDVARAVWNGAIDRRPRLIARCVGTGDVVSALRFAREHDLEIAIRGGGHNVAGSAVCDDGIVIDHVEPERAAAGAQVATLLRVEDLDRHASALDVLVVPAAEVERERELGRGAVRIRGSP